MEQVTSALASRTPVKSNVQNSTQQSAGSVTKRWDSELKLQISGKLIAKSRLSNELMTLMVCLRHMWCRDSSLTSSSDVFFSRHRELPLKKYYLCRSSRIISLLSPRAMGICLNGLGPLRVQQKQWVPFTFLCWRLMLTELDLCWPCVQDLNFFSPQLPLCCTHHQIWDAMFPPQLWYQQWYYLPRYPPGKLISLDGCALLNILW